MLLTRVCTAAAWSEEALKSVFSNFGKVESVVLSKDGVGGSHVVFKRSGMLQTAVREAEKTSASLPDCTQCTSVKGWCFFFVWLCRIIDMVQIG